jgi:hypothetical protein
MVMGATPANADDTPKVTIACVGSGLAEPLGTKVIVVAANEGSSNDLRLALGVWGFYVIYMPDVNRIAIMRIDLNDKSEISAEGPAQQWVRLGATDAEHRQLQIKCRITPPPAVKGTR